MLSFLGEKPHSSGHKHIFAMTTLLAAQMQLRGTPAPSIAKPQLMRPLLQPLMDARAQGRQRTRGQWGATRPTACLPLAPLPNDYGRYCGRRCGRPTIGCRPTQHHRCGRYCGGRPTIG